MSNADTPEPRPVAASGSGGELQLLRHPALRVAEIAGKGRGLIAAEPIAAGTLLEAAPVIPMRAADRLAASHPLSDYAFAWDFPPHEEAIALGLVSLVNHSSRPNATIKCDYDTLTLRLVALTPIAAGEEITFDYGIALWFDARDA
jgi:SET domain-containing protein